MAFIEYIAGESAPPAVAEAFGRHRSRDGGVDNILRIQGANPKSMDAHVGLYRALMFGASPLSRVQREMLALVVSAVNACHY